MTKQSKGHVGENWVILAVFVVVILDVLVCSFFEHKIPPVVTMTLYVLLALVGAHYLFARFPSSARVRYRGERIVIALGGAFAGMVVLIWILVKADPTLAPGPEERIVAPAGMSPKMPVPVSKGPPVAHLRLTQLNDQPAQPSQSVGLKCTAAGEVTGLADGAHVFVVTEGTGELSGRRWVSLAQVLKHVATWHADVSFDLPDGEVVGEFKVFALATFQENVSPSQLPQDAVPSEELRVHVCRWFTRS